MAKPTKVPTWATDADYSNGPEVGTPTKADPGAGVQAEGYIPQTRLAAQVINWWQNLVGQWTSWLDSTFAGGGGDPIEFLEPLDSVHSLGDVGAGGEFLYVDASGAPITKTRVINVSGNAPISVSSGATYDGSVWTLQPSNTIRIPVGPIPSGATITRVRAGVLLNGIGAEVTMRFYRVRATTSDGLPQGRTQIGSDQTWGGVSVDWTLDLSGLSESVNRQTDHHYVEIVTGSGGTSCQVRGVFVDFSDPGPRNF